MVCIEKRPYTLYGRLATLHFRYLTCLLDRGHIKPPAAAFINSGIPLLCYSYRIFVTLTVHDKVLLFKTAVTVVVPALRATT